ncbi:hypothetical protein ACFPRL_16415 [Pseudoclavibacter helvolus]
MHCTALLHCTACSAIASAFRSVLETQVLSTLRRLGSRSCGVILACHRVGAQEVRAADGREPTMQGESVSG